MMDFQSKKQLRDNGQERRKGHETRLEQVPSKSGYCFVREAKSCQHGTPLLWRFVHRRQLQSRSENRQHLQVGESQQGPHSANALGPIF